MLYSQQSLRQTGVGTSKRRGDYTRAARRAELLLASFAVKENLPSPCSPRGEIPVLMYIREHVLPHAQCRKLSLTGFNCTKGDFNS